ncbi:MAG: hypothetical protein SFW36_04810 [Leptolyngbyaceae cyanobacterium bins.59]|nr:hypothetical protein [Leptolyngbyaceae cyanobacterium bins.59]
MGKTEFWETADWEILTAYSISVGSRSVDRSSVIKAGAAGSSKVRSNGTSLEHGVGAKSSGVRSTDTFSASPSANGFAKGLTSGGSSR